MQSLGRYEVIRELLHGGMATVYLARDPIVDRVVAIKVLSPHLMQDMEFRARFEREERVIAALEHAAVVPIYDFGEHEGQPFIVMRYMPGGTLAERIAEGSLTGPQINRIVERLADALDDAHSKGMIHRDLKPRNVLFDAKGHAFLTDFGLAKMVETGQTITATGIVGTPAYMSPEQAQGESLDHRSDVYALGLIVYEMLTGRLPYKADTPMGIAVKHIVEPVPQIRSLNPDYSLDCESVIAKALAKNPADRFQSAGELAQAVAQLPEMRRPAGQLAGEAQPAEAGPPSRAWTMWPVELRKRWRPALGVALLSGIVLTVLGGAFSRFSPMAGAGGPSATAPVASVAPDVIDKPTATRQPAASPTPRPATPTTVPDTVALNEDEAAMVLIPAGSFQMGYAEGDVDERPIHTVALDEYWIDQTEVTNERYQACVAASECRPPRQQSSVKRGNYYSNPEFANYPVIHVDWNDATAYCAWAGKRLPTEAEWEYAARGSDGRLYPWGNNRATTSLLNYDFKVGDTTEAGRYTDSASPFGLLDMAGNVYEWVADWYGNDYYSLSPEANPTGPSTGVYRVLRGGSWNVNEYGARTADRFRLEPSLTFGHIGFRCARSP